VQGAAGTVKRVLVGVWGWCWGVTVQKNPHWVCERAKVDGGEKGEVNEGGKREAEHGFQTMVGGQEKYKGEKSCGCQRR